MWETSRDDLATKLSLRILDQTSTNKLQNNQTGTEEGATADNLLLVSIHMFSLSNFNESTRFTTNKNKHFVWYQTT